MSGDRIVAMFSAEKRPTLLGYILLLAFLALYGATLQQFVSTADNAEFQLVGTQLGLAHPPGFPLYTLLAHAMTRLPISIAPHIKINFLSAITSSLTLLFIYLSSYRLSRNVWASWAAAAALGTATTFWQQAVYANVRSMTALFAAICIWSLICWHEKQETDHYYLIVFALALGFGFTHHLSLAFMGLAMVLWVLWQNWRSWRWLPFGLFGLLPWVYLPLVSADLRTPTAFLNYALGLGFGGDFFYFITPADIWARLGIMLNVLTFQTHWIILLFALIGVLVYWQINRPIVGLLLTTFGLHTFITATYRAPQTVEYMLPAYVPLAICVALAIGQPKRHKQQWLRIGLGIVLTSVILFEANTKLRSFRMLAIDHHAEQYANDLLASAAGGSQILSNWHWFNTLRYLQSSRETAEIVYVVPSGTSYAANWVTMIEENLAAQRTTLATNDWPEFDYQLPIAEPIGKAQQWSAMPHNRLPDRFQAADLTLGQWLNIVGYEVNKGVLTVGEETAVDVVWKPLIADLPPASLFVHLVGADGQIYAQSDVAARPVAEGVTITRFYLTPRWGAPSGNYRLLVGAYLADGTALVDSAENPRPLLTFLSLHAKSWQPYTRNPLNRIADNGDRLIGYDYDCTLADQPRSYHHYQTANNQYYSKTVAGLQAPVALRRTPRCNTYVPLGHGIVWLGSHHPQSLHANNTYKLTQQFVSTHPIVHDLAVSVSLTGFADDGVTWAWQELHDSIPAMGAIPTLKWIQGSWVRDPHWVSVPDSATVGQTVEARLTIYDAFTNRPIPILDERITQQGGGIPLFRTSIEPTSRQ